MTFLSKWEAFEGKVAGGDEKRVIKTIKERKGIFLKGRIDF